MSDNDSKEASTAIAIELPDGSLGHTPRRRFAPARVARSLVSKHAWFGDYDYASLFIPNIPWVCRARSLPFYGVDDDLPHLLKLILGLQHALAMVGGLVVPPLLLGGSAGANLGPDVQQYLISACLIWCAVGTAVQIARHRIPRTRYYFGTGLISVVGTSFTFANVALKYLAQAYDNGTCPTAEDGTRLPCPREFGAILGTGALTGIFAIALAFVPPKTIRKAFPPLVIGTMICFIGASLVSAGITNWAGGSGACMTDHTLLCSSGSQSHPWGSAQYLGLGFSCFAVIVICEVFGSAFMKSASVFIGFVTGMIIAAATGYFDGSVIRAAPGGTFLFIHTFPLGLRGQLVLPMLASWAVIVAESIGNITASAQASNLDIETDDFMTRVQGGMLADAVSATLANLCTITPLTTFAQNSAVIALTRNASRQSGYMCAFLLFVMGVVGKFGAIFVAAPPAVIGGFTTFLFGSVAVSGIRIMAFAEWTRRDRFIATAAFALGLASLVSPDWFSYIFTYKGENKALQGFLQALVLVVEEAYLIAALVGVFLNLVLPWDHEDAPDEKH
ncbi:nucleoside transporter [Cutaneotrichosporon oleaginosum]|uniref:Nucleoside transporter n=1 Tax=Cutaneotrichosporon oleaginosum TaxID=879819 RepID=A0A0J0XJG2_9TREE|nr:nucleoside transporter [Cutaneotrichosporon oleaginosum]KLT41218.1 nucleoside transporter [Cutaneotrichosporon oleaginosum]TXT05484.1 hypothetical protein COLE_06804 [Cutaneotrichosporon oleaginosum]